MKKKTGILCSVLLVASGLWLWFGYYQPVAFRNRLLNSRAADTGSEQFQNAKREIAPIFVAAQNVQTFRLHSDQLSIAREGKNTKSQKPAGQVSGFYFRKRGKDGDAGFARRLGEVVLDPRGYPGISTLCKFVPATAFRVQSSKNWVDVVICFACNQLMVVENNPKIPLQDLGGTQRRFRIDGQFDVYRLELVELAQEAFPDDAEIQSLSKRIPLMP